MSDTKATVVFGIRVTPQTLELLRWRAFEVRMSRAGLAGAILEAVLDPCAPPLPDAIKAAVQRAQAPPAPPASIAGLVAGDAVPEAEPAQIPQRRRKATVAQTRRSKRPGRAEDR